MHWHPNADEWQYYIAGQAAMTIFNVGPRAVTQNFNPGDIGYVKKSLGHYIKNTGNTDLVFLEIFRADRFEDVSLSDWLTHAPRSRGHSTSSSVIAGSQQQAVCRCKKPVRLSVCARRRKPPLRFGSVCRPQRVVVSPERDRLTPVPVDCRRLELQPKRGRVLPCSGRRLDVDSWGLTCCRVGLARSFGDRPERTPNGLKNPKYRLAGIVVMAAVRRRRAHRVVMPARR